MQISSLECQAAHCTSPVFSLSEQKVCKYFCIFRKHYNFFLHFLIHFDICFRSDIKFLGDLPECTVWVAACWRGRSFDFSITKSV